MATIYETLEKIDKLKQHKRKVDQLKDAGDFVVLTIIQGAYNKNIKFNMPPGAPPYEINEGAEEKEVTKKALGIMVQTVMDTNIVQWKREKIFTDFLKSINPQDAELVIAMKDKDLTSIFPTINKELAQEAFPKYVK